MAYYNVCPECGAFLDPGERCDCQSNKALEEAEKKKREREFQKLFIESKNGQLRLAV